jgi:hypothetical protein
MRLKVTEEGLLIPKELLQGAEEVDVTKEDNLILVMPAGKADPILDLGRFPVKSGVSDGSEKHDAYLSKRGA